MNLEPSFKKVLAIWMKYLVNLLQIYQDTSILSHVSNCDGALFEIYLDSKFQWPQVGLKSKSLAYEEVTLPSYVGNYFVCKREKTS